MYEQIPIRQYRGGSASSKDGPYDDRPLGFRDAVFAENVVFSNWIKQIEYRKEIWVTIVPRFEYFPVRDRARSEKDRRDVWLPDGSSGRRRGAIGDGCRRGFFFCRRARDGAEDRGEEKAILPFNCWPVYRKLGRGCCCCTRSNTYARPGKNIPRALAFPVRRPAKTARQRQFYLIPVENWKYNVPAAAMCIYYV